MTQHLTAMRRDQIVDLYRRGEKVLSIAELFNVTSSHVSKLAKGRGLPLRRPIERRRRFRNEQGGRQARLTTGPAA